MAPLWQGASESFTIQCLSAMAAHLHANCIYDDYPDTYFINSRTHAYAPYWDPGGIAPTSNGACYWGGADDCSGAHVNARRFCACALST